MKKRTIETIEEFNDQGRLIWKSVTETTEYNDKPTDVPQENTVCSCFHPEEIGDRCWGTKEREFCSCGGDKSCCDFYDFKKE